MTYLSYNRGYRACVSLTLLLLLCMIVPLTSHAKIVFSAKRKHTGDTRYHIYVMEDDGSNVKRITSPAFYDRYPSWFPDGRKILFERDLSKGTGTICSFYTMDATGLNEQRVIMNHPKDRYPVLSPDGKQIAFNSNRTGHWDIFTVNLESGQLRNLTDNTFPNEWSFGMDWSPNGKRITYKHEDKHNGNNIWIMEEDGNWKRLFSPLTRIGTVTRRSDPHWSPSGRYIMYDEMILVFDDDRVLQPSASRLIIQNVLTGEQNIHSFPRKTRISPGCWMGNDHTVLLALQYNGDDPDARYDIYRYDLNSRRVTNLTNLPMGHAYHPDWIEGPLAVIPVGKLTIRWAEVKQAN